MTEPDNSSSLTPPVRFSCLAAFMNFPIQRGGVPPDLTAVLEILLHDWNPTLEVQYYSDNGHGHWYNLNPKRRNESLSTILYNCQKKTEVKTGVKFQLKAGIFIKIDGTDTNVAMVDKDGLWIQLGDQWASDLEKNPKFQAYIRSLNEEKGWALLTGEK